MSFKASNSIDKRKESSRQLLMKYPDKIPVIASNYNDKDDFKKFLVPHDTCIRELISTIRKNTNITNAEGIVLYINNTLPIYSTSMINVYEKNMDKDGFLYIDYCLENTFG